MRFTSHSLTGEEFMMEACVIACNSSPFHFPPSVVLQPLYFSHQAGLKKLKKPIQGKCNPWPTHDLRMYYKDLRVSLQYTDLLPVAL